MPGALRDGVIVASVTPFLPDERIDYTSWQSHLERWLASGASGVLAIGDAGEFHALSEEERVVAMRFCRQTIGTRGHLYGYAGGAATRESVRLAQAAEAEGLDAIVIGPPPWVELSVDESAEQLAEVARSVRIPVFRASEIKASVTANIAPGAEKLEAIFKLHTFPSGVKAAMTRAGFPAGVPRSPVSPFPSSLYAKLDAALAALGIECPTV